MRTILILTIALMAGNAFAGFPGFNGGRGRPNPGIMAGPEAYNCTGEEGEFFTTKLNIVSSGDSFTIKNPTKDGNVYSVKSTERDGYKLLVSGEVFNAFIACMGGCGITEFLVTIDPDQEMGSTLETVNTRFDEFTGVYVTSERTQDLTCHQIKY